MKLFKDFIFNLFTTSRLIFITSGLAFFTLACSTNEVKGPGRGRIDPSAYAADNMMFNKPQSQRELQSFDFYYKHCQVDERTPPPRGAIWECTEP